MAIRKCQAENCEQMIYFSLRMPETKVAEASVEGGNIANVRSTAKEKVEENDDPMEHYIVLFCEAGHKNLIEYIPDKNENQ